VLRDADLRREVSRIGAPVLVVSGTNDPATPPADADYLCAHIPEALRVDLAAAHLSNVELADAFTAAVLNFLLPVEGDRWTTTHDARWAKPSGARSSAMPMSTPPLRRRTD
jgi:hypothetical protein